MGGVVGGSEMGVWLAMWLIIHGVFWMQMTWTLSTLL